MLRPFFSTEKQKCINTQGGYVQFYLRYAIVDVSQPVSVTVLSLSHGAEVTDVTVQTGMITNELGPGKCSLTAELPLEPCPDLILDCRDIQTELLGQCLSPFCINVDSWFAPIY